jgi:hypothetical protein
MRAILLGITLSLNACVVKSPAAVPPPVVALSAPSPALDAQRLAAEALAEKVDGVDARDRLALLRDLLVDGQRSGPEAQALIARYADALLGVESRAVPQEAPTVPLGAEGAVFVEPGLITEGVVLAVAPKPAAPAPVRDPREEATAAMAAQDPARALAALAACAEGACDADLMRLYAWAQQRTIASTRSAVARLRKEAADEPDEVVRLDMLATAEADLESLLARFPKAEEAPAILAERDAVRAERLALTPAP